MKGWIEVFSTGKHTSNNGHTKQWTESDLDMMVDSYSSDKHEAPVVIGHPQSNHPAYGWVEGLKRTGKTLLAKFKQVEPQFAEMVEKGRFKKRSISVYPDGTLRHVGFLGAQPPAVKGLKDISFGDEEAVTYEFQDMEETMPTVEELQKQLDDEKKKRLAAESEAKQNKARADKSESDFAEHQKKSKRKEIESFVEQGIKDGKILPAWKDQGLVEFMDSLQSHEETYEFSEGKKETPAAWFKNFLESFSEHPLFKEMTPPDKESKDDFAEEEKLGEEIAGTVNA